ncbi:tryptophan synthase subunit alpha [Candidatus Berkiella cookevillensis]|uniref:Tryptophan synthase alpha chain n=1 Tax=Candidatus Berkiella cookevillensis TaxID=437022 RepID=A0A0Q9YCW2_9GAMM|nr:tryptophan synthase subunit alpha [Candidatus Berkiella cookevillensis]MCS5708174.1 tryptophan synthase subunit alpha [Candidatus Berkiella cookevillensis]
MRFSIMFEKLKNTNSLLVMPYLSLGLLNEDATIELIQFFVEHGAQAIEFGFPFSDAIADGPIIQQASKLAIENGFSHEQGFSIIARIRSLYPNLPICLMLYANHVYSYSVDNFYAQCKQSGIDAVLIPDIPNVEMMPFLKSAKSYDIQPVLFATPSCAAKELAFTAKHSEGFVYLVTRTGVTGTKQAANFDQMIPMIQQLQSLQSAPIVCGFGIKHASDLHKAQQSNSQGVIIGSALMEALLPTETHPEPSLSVAKNVFKDIIMN